MRMIKLPTRRIARVPIEKGHVLCIGCEKDLSSGFSYTGSMITGVQFQTIRDEVRLPILGTIETFDRSYVIGGELVDRERKIGYYGRKKGPLCDECSTLCAKTIVDQRGNKHQVVILDPRPGYIGRTLEDYMK